MIFWQHASAEGRVRIFTLAHWTFGFLASPARTKDEIRLKIFLDPSNGIRCHWFFCQKHVMDRE